MVRLSGLFAAKPAAPLANGARYYATDLAQVYVSAGGQWLAKSGLDDDGANGQNAGATLAARPDANTCIGYVWTDAATGNQYEAFPNAWALLNDLTPALSLVTKKMSFTLAQIKALGAVTIGNLPAFAVPAKSVLMEFCIKHSEQFVGPGLSNALIALSSDAIGTFSAAPLVSDPVSDVELSADTGGYTLPHQLGWSGDNIFVVVNLTDCNAADLTAGAFDIWVGYFVRD